MPVSLITTVLKEADNRCCSCRKKYIWTQQIISQAFKHYGPSNLVSLYFGGSEQQKNLAFEAEKHGIASEV